MAIQIILKEEGKKQVEITLEIIQLLCLDLTEMEQARVNRIFRLKLLPALRDCVQSGELNRVIVS